MSHRTGEHPGKRCSPCVWASALITNFCEILPACSPSLLHPTRSFSARAGTLGTPDWVAGPANALAVAGPGPWGPGFWRWRPRRRDSGRVPSRAREKLGCRGAPADSVEEAHPHPLRTAAAPATPARPRALSLGGPGVHPEGEKTPLVPGAGRQADRGSSPAPPARLTHPLAAAAPSPPALGPQPQPGPGPAPGPPRPRPQVRPVVAPPPAHGRPRFCRVLCADLCNVVSFFCLWSPLWSQVAS